MSNKFRKFMMNAAKAAKKNKEAEILKKAHVEPDKETVSKQKPETPLSESQTSNPTFSLHENLSDAGVPVDLSKKMHHVVENHAAQGVKKMLGSAIKKAIDHKKKGNITQESLVKIISEAVTENEKGTSKEELTALISEILKSELNKGELLKAHHQKTHPDEPLEDLHEGGMPNVSMPVPSKIKEDLEGLAQKDMVKREDLTKTNLTYPLIYNKGRIHVYENIRYNPFLL